MISFSNVKAIAIGGLIGFFATDVCVVIANNFCVNTFLERSAFSLDTLMPAKYQDWPKKDVRLVLSRMDDGRGHMSCLHVTPIKPTYQVVSTLDTGKQVCCSILSGDALEVPVLRRDNSTDYYCGTFPNQQIVRVMDGKDIKGS